MHYIPALYLRMKFEDFLTQPYDQKSKRVALEEEVEELRQRLIEEMKLKSVLRYALKGPIVSCYPLPPLLPFKVQTLLVELEMLENEIIWLEAKLKKLKIGLYTEKMLNKDANLIQATKGFQIPQEASKNNNNMESAMMIFPKFMHVKDKMVILNCNV